MPISLSKIYRVRKRIISPNSSYKKLKIAKKIIPPLGSPLPLSLEEDLALELNGKADDFFKPLSFYKFIETEKPELKVQSDGNVHPRSIVGPVETFKKTWKNKHNSSVKEVLKRNKSLYLFTMNSIKNSNFPVVLVKKDEENKNGRILNKVELLHEKQNRY